MTIFKEIRIGKFALRFFPADNGWVCGITEQMMEGLVDQEDEVVVLPIDPTDEMKTAAVNVDLFDNDTGKDYTLSWEEAEEIYWAMRRASPNGEE